MPRQRGDPSLGATYSMCRVFTVPFVCGCVCVCLRAGGNVQACVRVHACAYMCVFVCTDAKARRAQV